jgi:hypothetical protein
MRVPRLRKPTSDRQDAVTRGMLLCALAGIAASWMGCAALQTTDSEVLVHRQELGCKTDAPHLSTMCLRESGNAGCGLEGFDSVTPGPPRWRTAMTRSIARWAGPCLIAPAALFAAIVPMRAADWIEVQSAAGAVVISGVAPRDSACESGAADAVDPLELLQRARERCAQEVRDYACLFLRQERVRGKLTKPQTIKVLYRDEPHSVYMTWIRNTDRVRRASYVKGRLVNERGEEQALVEPAGAIARLFVSEMKIPIHGPEARRSGRHTIDQFGFRVVLDRILRENQRFVALGGVEWTYEGEGTVDGRPTHVLVRHLPYTGPKGDYPDARLVVHLDQEQLWPAAIHSFADEQERELLGSYVTTRVELNPGLTSADFEFSVGK